MNVPSVSMSNTVRKPFELKSSAGHKKLPQHTTTHSLHSVNVSTERLCESGVDGWKGVVG